MSDDLRKLLGEWKAMADAATEGPWSATHGPRELPRIWSDAPQFESAEPIAKCAFPGDVDDAEFIAASRTLVPRLIAAVEAVLKVHRPGGVYDKCECVDPDPDDGVHIEVEEVGITCNCNYEVCRECCTGDEYLTESCTDYHDHKPGDKHLCPTVAALHAALIGEDDE